MLEKGYYVPLDDLEPEVKEWIMNSKVKNFLSVAPQWKETSKSTKCRTAVNASRKSNREGKSLNDLMSCGLNELNLDHTFRRFKISHTVAVADIRKFYMQVYINKKSLPLQLLLWRKDLNPKEEAKTYVIARLQYGIKAASRLAGLSLQLICTFGEQNCKECSGKFSYFENIKPRII